MTKPDASSYVSLPLSCNGKISFTSHNPIDIFSRGNVIGIFYSPIVLNYNNIYDKCNCRYVDWRWVIFCVDVSPMAIFMEEGTALFRLEPIDSV